MLDLVQVSPDTHLHVLDLPYRFSSWAFDTPENVGLWSDDRGRLLGWAVMQTPFWAVDWALHPDAPGSLLGEILAWSDRRARETRDTPSGRPMWFLNVLGDAAFARL
jgi:hypothetical protein